jgi:hypothetical protein
MGTTKFIKANYTFNYASSSVLHRFLPSWKTTSWKPYFRAKIYLPLVISYEEIIYDYTLRDCLIFYFIYISESRAWRGCSCSIWSGPLIGCLGRDDRVHFYSKQPAFPRSPSPAPWRVKRDKKGKCGPLSSFFPWLDHLQTNKWARKCGCTCHWDGYLVRVKGF